MSERMNKERAVEIIKDLKQEAKVDEPELKYTDEEYSQALDIAIESLQDEVEELEKMESKALEDYSEETIKKAVSKFSKTIKQLNNRIQGKDNEWVDVRKQLPKFDEEVLVEMKDGSHCVATYHTETFNNKTILYWTYNDFTKYYCDDEKKEKNEVVAWKKVEPYERKE